MFDDNGTPYIVDFGIAKLMSSNTGLTGTGMTVGTPNFMPPEQWRGDPVTPSADQYALAVIVYNILTGKLPFEGDTPFVLMHKHLNEYPTPPHQRRIDLPPNLTPILLRAMAKNPQDRFVNCSEFANALSSVASGNIGMMTNPYNPPMPSTTPPNMAYQTPPPPYQTPPPTPYGAYPLPAPKKQNNALIGVLVGIMLLAIIGVLVVVMGQGGDNSSASTTTTATSAGVVILPTDTAPPVVTSDEILSPTAEPTTSPIPTETHLLTNTDAPTNTDMPTWTPIPTSTSEPTAIPTDTPAPTVDVLAVVARLDATSTAENALKLTATALSWTDTPTPDISATINAIMAERTATQSAIIDQTATQLVINKQTEIALSWTPTPSATMTLRPTSTPRPTDTTALPPLVASFVANLIDAQTVYVEATVSGGTGDYIYTWDFGDGTIAEDADSSIYHTYGFAGTYTITLTVGDGRDYQFAQTSITLDPPTPTLARETNFDGVNLTFAVPDYVADSLGDIIDQFTQETGVTVELTGYSDYITVIQTMAAAGALPDVFWMAGEYVDNWANSGILLPMTGIIEDESDFYYTVLESARVGNDYYCIPRDFSTLALLYNPAWFDELGLEYPTHDWTWDDLLNHVYIFYEAMGESSGFYIDNYFAWWLPYIYQAGGRVYDIDNGIMSFDSPEVRDALQFLINLRSASSTINEMPDSWSGGLFGENRVAMVVNGSWMLSIMSSYPDIQMRAVQLPSGLTEGSISFNTCYGVSSITQYPEASVLFANFLARPDIQSQLISSSAIPSRISVAEDYVHYWLNYADQFGFVLSRDTIETFIIAAYDAVPYKLPYVTSFPSFDIENILMAAFNGEISAEEAQDMMQDVVQSK